MAQPWGCQRPAASCDSRLQPMSSHTLTYAQLNEHAPGPRASPHLPQGFGAGAGVALRVLTANTDNCLSRCPPRQEGHAGVAPFDTSVSKR